MTQIRSTHTGSLPRPDQLAEAIMDLEETGRARPDLEPLTDDAVRETVRQQVAVGLDIVNDGEMGRLGYTSYVKDRLGGFRGEDVGGFANTDVAEFPEFAAREARWKPVRHIPACTAPITPGDPAVLTAEIARLKAAGAAAGARDLFMTAPSPGVVSIFFADRYYGRREAYLEAIGEAMRPDYEAIVEAGLTLQLDCPDLAMGRHAAFGSLDVEGFRQQARLAVEALNSATRNIPPERMRIHLCWGNYEGPHHHDIELRQIIDVVLGLRPAGLGLEACNPRHGHEWRVFEDVDLPRGKYLIPGVIDSTTNYIEHPELVAERLLNYARLVGPDRVVAGADCGFGTSVVREWRVVPAITWAKLGAMVEGARIASAAL